MDHRALKKEFKYSRAPWKWLYLGYQIISTNLVRFPFWFILYSFPFLRPRRSWSRNRALTVRQARHWTEVINQTGPLRESPDYRDIRPGEGVQAVWLNPVPKLVVGELKTWATVADVECVRIPGYWFHKKGSTIVVGASPIPGEKVVLKFHGGGYILLSAHPTDVTAAISRLLLKHVDKVQRVLSVEYRLSKGYPLTPEHPFPAALLDALAGYNYLVNEVGFAPEDVIFEGDSAGGNLALALARYLVENHNSIEAPIPKPPGALILCSPWVDMGDSHDNCESFKTCVQSDFIGNSAYYPRNAFLGPLGWGAANMNRYISPGSIGPLMKVSFAGFPRTFIVCGEAEILRDQIRALKDKMVRDLGEGDGANPNGGKVKYYELKDGTHDYFVFSAFEPERGNTLMAINAWLNSAE